MPKSAAPAVHRFAVSALTEQSAAIFTAAGMRAHDALRAAALLVDCDCYGIETHGVARVPIYTERLLSGEFNPLPTYRWERLGPAVWRMDADAAMGQLAALDCVERLIEEARTTVLSVAFVSDIGHLGALASYARRAAEAGMFAIVMQATPPVIAPPGSGRAAVGNNPIAFAAPLPHAAPPLVFDMANSIAARGKVIAAARDGESIPAHWGVGPDGLPTTDPSVALKGALQPVGGHKGIGLAMLVECLAGIATGSSLTGSLGPDGEGRPGFGHGGAFIAVIDGATVAGSRAEWDARMERFLELYESYAGDAARIPGARGAALYGERRREGVTLGPALLAQLRALCADLHVPYALEPAD